MGLDMYAYVIPDRPEAAVDFAVKADDKELHYWRKHPNLHGWMEALYYEKGGTADSFNCNTLLLTANDLDRLEMDIRHGALPFTDGCFFGKSDGSETEDDLAFIAKARAEIAAGRFVFYDSWW